MWKIFELYKRKNQHDFLIEYGKCNEKSIHIQLNLFVYFPQKKPGTVQLRNVCHGNDSYAFKIFCLKIYNRFCRNSKVLAKIIQNNRALFKLIETCKHFRVVIDKLAKI